MDWNKEMLGKRSIEVKTEVHKMLQDSLRDEKKVDDVFHLMENLKFFVAPASTKYHLAYPTGLAEHSINVAKHLQELTDKLSLSWETPRSPILIGLLHDICKADYYVMTSGETNADGAPAYRVNSNALIKEHGMKSVILAQKAIELTDEEIACMIYHMGAFTEDTEWKNYTNAIHIYPNVLWTHTADMVAAHMTEYKSHEA